MAQVNMRDLLEAGVHFGHQKRYWNPKMGEFIFGARNDIHIINLEKTVPAFEEALAFVASLAAISASHSSRRAASAAGFRQGAGGPGVSVGEAAPHTGGRQRRTLHRALPLV